MNFIDLKMLALKRFVRTPDWGLMGFKFIVTVPKKACTSLAVHRLGIADYVGIKLSYSATYRSDIRP
jgi:hypothetical protein